MPTKKIYTIVVNHDGREYLRDCLGSLSRTKIAGYRHKIIFIDNASMDKSVIYVRKKFPKIRIKIFHRNKGFTGAVNFGMNYALKHHARYVLLINNDTKVRPTFLQKLISFVDRKKGIGIVSPLILYPGKEQKIWFAGGRIDPKRFSSGHLLLGEQIPLNLKKPYESEYLSGCCLLIKTKLIGEIGFLDDRYFLYYEDMDYCLRARKAGYKCFIVPKAKMIHKQNPSELDEAHKEYYLTRNHLLILRKLAPFKIKLREHIRTLKTIYEKMKIQDDNIIAQYALLGIKDYLLRRFGKREHWY